VTGSNTEDEGYVQDTGRGNAIKAGKALNGQTIAGVTITPTTFTDDPEKFLVPEISYADAIDAMLTGRYTGAKIGTFINDSRKDYRSARRVINGTDRASDIAGYAAKFESALTGAIESEEHSEPEVADNTASAPTTTPDATATPAPEEAATLTFADVKQHISTDTFKSIAQQVGWKAASGIGGLWSVGVHGKVLIILAGIIVLGFGTYELVKHWQQLKRFAIAEIKGSNNGDSNNGNSNGGS
jgi:hypothetical protein